MDYTAFFQLWSGRKLGGIYLFAYGPTILDADLPLTSLHETGRSRGYWFSAEVDERIRAQRAEPDAARRLALIARIWQISREKVPYVALYNEIPADGIRETVKWSPRPNDLLIFKDASVSPAVGRR